VRVSFKIPHPRKAFAFLKYSLKSPFRELQAVYAFAGFVTGKIINNAFKLNLFSQDGSVMIL